MRRARDPSLARVGPRLAREVARIVVVVETLALSLSGRFRRHRRRRVVVAALEQHPLLAHNSLVAVNQSIWDVW